VIMHLYIHPDYHVYAPSALPEEVQPLHLELIEPQGVLLEPHFPAGESWDPAQDNQPVVIYRGRVQVPMLVNGVQPGEALQVRLRYQACNQNACLPSKEKTIRIELPAE